MNDEDKLIRLVHGEEQLKIKTINLISTGRWEEATLTFEKGKIFEKDIKELKEKLKNSS